MRRTLALLVMLACTAYGQQEGASVPKGILVVRAEGVAGDIVIDGVVVGRSPGAAVAVSAGRHVVRLVAPAVGVWGASSVSDSVVVVGDDTSAVVLTASFSTYVASTPPGAEVSVRNVVVGTTPFLLRSSGVGDTVAVLSKDNFERAEVRLPHPGVVTLKSTNDEWRNEVPEAMKGMEGGWTTEEVLTASSAGTLIVSGIAAAYFKDRAESEFDRYLRTGDANAWAATQTYDRLSTATFVVAQVSFATLTYLLLSD